MKTTSAFRVFWRYLLPCILLVWLAMEGFAGGMWLMNQPSDLGVAGGVLLILASAALVIGVCGYIFKGAK
jgi:hypothetical protein